MNIELQEILTQAVAFLALWFLLKKFAWSSLLKLLDDRKEKIQTTLEDIDTKTKAVEKLHADYEHKLKDIEHLTRQKLNEAIVEGQKLASQIQDKAHEDIKKLMDKAKESLELEISKARIDFRVQMSHLAIQAAEKIIRTELNTEKHEKLALDFIKSVDSKV